MERCSKKVQGQIVQDLADGIEFCFSVVTEKTSETPDGGQSSELPQAAVTKYQKLGDLPANVFRMVLGPGSLISRCWQIQRLMKTHFPVHTLLSAVSSHRKKDKGAFFSHF